MNENERRGEKERETVCGKVGELMDSRRRTWNVVATAGEERQILLASPD